MQHVSDRIIISDTSALIILGKIGAIGLLQVLAEEVFVTTEIAKEYGMDLPDWIKIRDAENSNLLKILESEVDKGEASAIALALEEKKGLLIIDDLKGRKLAEKLEIRYSGSLGVLLKAKQIGAIEAVKPFVNKIQKTNFRLSKKLLERLLTEASE